MNKVVEYLKMYSGWVLLVVLIVVLFFVLGTGVTDQDLVKKTKKYVEKKKKTIDAINELGNAKTKRDRKIVDRYSDIFLKIDQDYKKKRENLDDKERQELEFLVKKTQKSPSIVAQRMARKYGWEYVE